MINKISIFGTHDENTLNQLSEVANRAVRVALMSDGHLGYIMPVGGVAAYDNQISVPGVGYDIACISKGTPVITSNGYWIPIDAVSDKDPIIGVDGGSIRNIEPHFGSIYKGDKSTIKFTFEDGRTLECTKDHLINTRDGWKPASEFVIGDSVLAIPYTGFPYEEYVLPDEIAEQNCIHLVDNPTKWAAFLRLFGFAFGDGHLEKRGGRLSWYVYDKKDVDKVVNDVNKLGIVPKIYTRKKTRESKIEYQICISGKHSKVFEILGLPRGKKVGSWDLDTLNWIINQPLWAQSQFIDGFSSADATTPYILPSGLIGSISIIQTSDTEKVIKWISDIIRNLGIECNYGIHHRNDNGTSSYYLQIQGGDNGIVKFLSSISWCYSHKGRVGSANVISTILKREKIRLNRLNAYNEAIDIKGILPIKEICSLISVKYNVPLSLPYHALYGRGIPRAAGFIESDVEDECYLSEIVNIEDSGINPVYDIVTGDSAHCFIASGVVVHNCGNCAIKTNLKFWDLTGVSYENVKSNPYSIQSAPIINQLADEIFDNISFGIGRKNNSTDAPIDDPLFLDDRWYIIPNIGAYRDDLKDKARRQLGTIGSGNHYVDVFVDDDDFIWVGVHFGSRGFGHTIASNFLSLGQGGRWGERAKEVEVLLDLNTQLGQDYWDLMNLVGDYAYAGREWVTRKVVEILGGEEVKMVHNHHNFAWKESHWVDEAWDLGPEYPSAGVNHVKRLIVVRKGATPAFPGQRGFIGGSMGDDAVIVEGTIPNEDDVEEIGILQEDALYSTVHGAGRVMSRNDARGKIDRKTGTFKTRGKISQPMMQDWLREKGVILRGGGVDEAPQAYRRLPEVLASQRGTVKVLHTLHPIIVCMAPATEIDPYKD